MMAGGKPPKQPVLIPPPGVVSRRSSDVLAMSDRGLAAGVRFMREHLFETITTTQMARAAGMSRSIFNQRFITQIGRSPKAEVLRLRLARAKELLSVTDWTLAEIAERTGFKYAEYLHSIFTQKIGTTPGKFRQSIRQQPHQNHGVRI
jgi:LacI family transcriptional regulator